MYLDATGGRGGREATVGDGMLWDTIQKSTLGDLATRRGARAWWASLLGCRARGMGWSCGHRASTAAGADMRCPCGIVTLRPSFWIIQSSESSVFCSYRL